MEKLTRQELMYLAQGARGLASTARKDAAMHAGRSYENVFLHSAKVYDELALKCERIAKSMPV